ncbi:MAG: ATP-binding cassette domain-containing protein [Anaerolineae bacterium]|nr:ATP-binding cassette domain-containing protein [Anaerolineae bacterium]
MILIKDLSKIYRQGNFSLKALDGVSLEVANGEIFGVLGPSGAGKSTLIRCVNLLERPTSGSIFLDQQEITGLNAAELRKTRQRIGMIFQHFNLLSSRTVADNVAFPLEIVGVEKNKREARVKELLDLVGLSDKARVYPSQLSGGQKQRVGIARALANDPEVLLSDEATSALDPQNTSAILELLYDLNQRLGLTILLITHEMNVVRQICKRVAILEDGRIVEEGLVEDLAAQPETRLARAIFAPGELPEITPGATVATITFVGETAKQPVLASLVRRFDVNVNIIGGSIQKIGRHRVGQLQVELTGAQVKESITYLVNLPDLSVEVHQWIG